MSDIPTGLAFAAAPDAPETINVCAYGPGGSGKSTFAATAPGPIMWLNFEGAGALAYARKVARERGNEIFEVRFDPAADPRPQLRQVLDHLRDGHDPRPRTVVVDTIGKLRDSLVGVLVDPNSKSSLRQYGEVKKALTAVVRRLRDTDVNVVFLAHESIEDNDGDRIIRPQVGSFAEDLVGEVDVVAYTFRHVTDDGERYRGLLRESRGRRAKDRSGGLGETRDLDFADWLAGYQQALAAPAQDDLPFDVTDEPDTPADDPEHPDQQVLAA
jgi:hypothetical protein